MNEKWFWHENFVRFTAAAAAAARRAIVRATNMHAENLFEHTEQIAHDGQ